MKWTPKINVKDDAVDNADKKIAYIKQSSVFYLKFNKEEGNERHGEDRNSVLQATLSRPSWISRWIFARIDASAVRIILDEAR